MVLDNFHRSKHTWCLERMPEVDPTTTENKDILEAKNTEACEQLNSWISGRTSSGLEMTRGHFLIYWWALFDAHNEWLEKLASCLRRRYARGGMAHDPDQPRSHNTKICSETLSRNAAGSED